MSLFTNLNFISQLTKECGLTNLQEDVITMLQILVEIETRRLIQQAGKFMRNDMRDEIEFEDVQHGLGNLGHTELVLFAQDESYTRDGSSYIRRDPLYTSPKQFIQEELKALSLNSFSEPKLRSRWIYIDGKIPRINENSMLKAKSEIISIREKEIGQKDKKFNIIMDQPESMLTGYELDYFKETTELLSQEGDNLGKLEKVDLQGNLGNLFPLFLKFFIGTGVTELKMVYFLELLKNKYIDKSAEFHLHQILTYLWAYQGEHCLEVGQRIGSYIKNLGQKYPMLYQLWHNEPSDKRLLTNPQIRQTAYSSGIKKIGIELEVGIRATISPELLQWMEKDHKENKIPLARIMKQIVSEYSGRIACLRSYMLAYWIPSGENSGDPWIMMTL